MKATLKLTYYNLRKSLLILLAIVAFFLVHEFHTPQDGHIVFYMTPLVTAMSTIILPTIYLDRDYQSGWLTMVKAMPIKRSHVTGGYFLLPILSIICGSIILTIAYVMAQRGDLPVTSPLNYYFLVACVALMLSSVIITFMMKFGPTLAKLMPVFIMLISFGIPILFQWLMDAGMINGEALIEKVTHLLNGDISSMTMITFLVITIVVMLLGHRLSTKILNQKDF